MNLLRSGSTTGAAFVSGALFALGLVLSGMTNPFKVFGFLDFFGAWDPSLAAVMVGAIGVNAPFTLWLRRRQTPFLLSKSSSSVLPPWDARVDARLVVGAATFGVGWGLGGYCPGPALVSLPTSLGAGAEALTFTAAMVAGMFAFSLYDRRRLVKLAPSASASWTPGHNRGMVTRIEDVSSIE